MEEEKHIIHQVKAYDTLYGLALEYQVEARQIKEANGITNDEIYMHKEIKIPLKNMPGSLFQLDSPDEQAVQRQLMLTHFARVMEGNDRGDMKMAKYYLENNDYRLEDSEKEYYEDLAFEKNQKGAKQYTELGKYGKLE